jgi:hypothetical protein
VRVVNILRQSQVKVSIVQCTLSIKLKNHSFPNLFCFYENSSFLDLSVPIRCIRRYAIGLVVEALRNRAEVVGSIPDAGFKIFY